MAVELAQGYVSMAVSTRGLGRDIGRQFDAVPVMADRAGQASGRRFGNGFGASVKGAMGAGIGAIASGAKYGVLALGGLAVAGAGVGVKTAAGLETAKIGFTTMLGSGKKAQTFLNDLAAFAAKTPFEFPELQKAASSLVSAGINAKDVIPIMTTLGDATAGMGTGAEGIQRATVALQQMNAAGKISGEDLNQLRDAGIPVYDLLAKATGKSKAEVVALAQAGKLGKKELDQLMGALKSGKGLERFNGLMEKTSTSLTGLASTFKDTIQMGLAEAIQPAIPLIKQGLGGAIKAVGTAMPFVVKGVGSFVKVLSDHLPGAIESLKMGWSGLVAGFKYGSGEITSDSRSLGGMGERLGAGLNKVVKVVKRGLGGVKEFFSAFKSSQSVDAFGGHLSTVSKAGIIVRDVFHKIAGVFHSIDWKAIGAGISDAFSKIGPAIQGIDFSKIAASIGKIDFKSLGDGIASFVGGIGDVDFGGLTAGAKPFSEILGFVGDHMDTLVKLMPLAVAAFIAYKGAQAANNTVGRDSLVGFGLQLAANGLLTASNFALAKSTKGVTKATEEQLVASGLSRGAMLKEAAAKAVNTIKTIILSAATKIAAISQAALNLVMSLNPIGLVVIAIGLLVAGFIIAYKHSDKFREVVNKAFTAIKKVAGAVLDWLREKVKSVIGFVKKHWDTIKLILVGPIGAAVILIKRHWGAITDKFNAVKNWVFGAFKTAWNKIQSLIMTPVSKARDAIKTLLGAGKSGLQGVFKSAVDAVGGIWNGLKEKTKVPIRFIVNTVLENGILKVFRTVAGLVGLGDLADKMHVSLPKGFDRGGWTGPGGEHDPAGLVHSDEFVVKKKSRIRFERSHPGALDRINETGEMPGYAQGGRVASGGLINWQGGRFTPTFAAHLKLAQQMAGETFHIFQGGWRPKTSYSGTSHRGDAVDLGSVSAKKVKALRANGIPSWDRTGMGNWAPHIHGIPLPGFGTALGSAIWQAQDYLKGGNGLGGRDNGLGSGDHSGGGLGSLFGGFLDPGKWLSKLASPFLGKLKQITGNVFGQLVSGIPKTLLTGLVDTVKNAFMGGSPVGYSSGTESAMPGWALVGENGPELRKLRSGDRIKSNPQARDMLSRPQSGGRGDTYVVANLEEAFRRRDLRDQNLATLNNLRGAGRG